MDKASVASRSKYGGFSIFFNPMKPGGKFHFRFYMLCCATTYACLSLQMHTQNVSDSASRFVPAKVVNNADDSSDSSDDDRDEDPDEEHIEETKIVSLVVDMCHILEGSGRVVNMDNYYMSPEVAVKLKSVDIFCRGTVWRDRFGFPPGVCFTKPEARKRDRGSTKTMVDVENGFVAHGWCDANPVHLLTTADGCGQSTVNRRVWQQTERVTTPSALRRYNKFLHAVDQHDQLRRLL